MRDQASKNTRRRDVPPRPLIRVSIAEPLTSRLSSVQTLTSRLDTSSDQFCRNREEMLGLIAEMNDLLEQATKGGGPESTERLIKRGKLPVRERVSLLLDADSPFLEIGPLAGYMTNQVIGGGMLIGIGVVNDV